MELFFVFKMRKVIPILFCFAFIYSMQLHSQINTYVKTYQVSASYATGSSYVNVVQNKKILTEAGTGLMLVAEINELGDTIKTKKIIAFTGGIGGGLIEDAGTALWVRGSRTDSVGNILWTKTYGGAGGEAATSLVKCSDGILIASNTNGFGQGGFDVCLLKLDFNGNLIWAKTYGTAIDEAASKVLQTPDNGFIIGGFYGVITGDRGGMIMKIDSVGNFQWAKSYGSTVCNDDLGGLVLAGDGGYVIYGTSCSFGGSEFNAYIIKTDSLGNSGCNEQNRTFTEMDITSMLTVTNPAPNVYSDVSIVAKNTQTTVYNPGLITNTLCFTTDVQETQKLKDEFKIYPNPNSGNFNLEYKLKQNESGIITIMDIAGKLVVSYTLEKNKSILSIYANELNNGVYLYQIVVNGNVVSANKLIIIK